MNREKKIELLTKVREGRVDVFRLLVENSPALPSWYWQQFDNDEELLADLKRNRGENLTVIWYEGKPYLIDKNIKPLKPRWFYEQAG